MEPNFNFWDNMAKRYPRFNDISMSKDVNHIINWCQNRNVSFEGASILDIGAGTGTIAIPLAQKGAHVTAMDISEGMLAALNEDAKEQGVSLQMHTHQSDWDSFPLSQQYDIVIASMTPAISDLQKIDKMLGATKGLGIYVGWGKYRINKLVEALVKAHIIEEEEDCASAGCIKAAQFIDILDERNIPYESSFFETSWSETYSFEEAKEYAYDQLKRKEIVPNEAIVESILSANLDGDKVQVTTEAEKGIILWRVA
ncbi:class I SAM-dependent methyltransferase [Sulfurospirillum multivorans]|uniref:Methyltransferase n=2 Tax=Sulfurospirillum multivorans TaxID=66821 RepID=A0AA86E3S2_SULMK|nr:class I SAM-dependent methyltransferase [Sulfurospirillum multivorans]AHJ14127.1 methyltransferase [Sulfurospirillum multivorans DSM 12446]QEH07612.1 methyltransferase [Sulfurospirillum multivorans]